VELQVLSESISSVSRTEYEQKKKEEKIKKEQERKELEEKNKRIAARSSKLQASR
jgi:hypothetical protein